MTDRMDLIRRPLADRAGAMKAAGAPGEVGLRELAPCAQIDLRGDAADAGFVAAVRSAAGVALPAEPNRVETAGERAALWLSPDEWLLLVPFAERTATLEKLRRELGDRHASVTDVSANRTILELAGPKAREVLAKGCGLDLHPRSFGPGDCAQTLLARSQALIWQSDETPTYRLLVRPSFAAHVADCPVGALAEYALSPIPR